MVVVVVVVDGPVMFLPLLFWSWCCCFLFHLGRCFETQRTARLIYLNTSLSDSMIQVLVSTTNTLLW